jgi:DNA-binding NtrC family response regulator
MKRPLALLLDLDEASRSSIEDGLVALGVDVRIASSSTEAIAALSEEPVFLLLVDWTTFGRDAADVLRASRRADPCLVPVAFRAEGVAAVDPELFLTVSGPMSLERLAWVVERARTQHGILTEIRQLRDDSRSWNRSSRLFGRSDAIESMLERLGRLAGSGENVLFVGEPGTGKELAAQVVHELSPRRKGPFVRIECAGSSADAVEAELGGGPDGAIGRAATGTLFLHEVADLAFPLQERLAVLFGPAAGAPGAEDALGFTAPDVRVIAGTSRRLDRAVSEGRFHEELYRRVAVEVVPVPPLRERPGDAAHLARRFLETICEWNEIPLLELSPEARERLERYGWPGNVTELRRAIERAALLASDGRIRPENLPDAIRDAIGEEAARATAAAQQFRDAKRVVVEEFEKAYLHELMQRRGGNVTAAAEEAGMLRSALQRLLRKYDLRSTAYRPPRTPTATPSTV